MHCYFEALDDKQFFILFLYFVSTSGLFTTLGSRLSTKSHLTAAFAGEFFSPLILLHFADSDVLFSLFRQHKSKAAIMMNQTK